MTAGSGGGSSYASVTEEARDMEAMLDEIAVALDVTFAVPEPVMSPCPGADEDGQERADYEIDVDVAELPSEEVLARVDEVLEAHGYSTDRGSAGDGRFVLGERGDANLMLGLFTTPGPRLAITANTDCYDA